MNNALCFAISLSEAAARTLSWRGTTGEWNRISNEERQRLIWIETDEVARINQEVSNYERQPVEAWVGVTAPTRLKRLRISNAR